MNLSEFNKEQMEFPRVFKMHIECDTANVALNFTPNFPFADQYLDIVKGLEKEWKFQLVGKPCDAEVVYSIILEVLACKLNGFGIGVVAPKAIVDLVEKRLNAKELRSQYCFFIKNSTFCEAPSFEEWLEKYY